MRFLVSAFAQSRLFFRFSYDNEIIRYNIVKRSMQTLRARTSKRSRGKQKNLNPLSEKPREAISTLTPPGVGSSVIIVRSSSLCFGCGTMVSFSSFIQPLCVNFNCAPSIANMFSWREWLAKQYMLNFPTLLPGVREYPLAYSIVCATVR